MRLLGGAGKNRARLESVGLVRTRPRSRWLPPAESLCRTVTGSDFFSFLVKITLLKIWMVNGVGYREGWRQFEKQPVTRFWTEVPAGGWGWGEEVVAGARGVGAEGGQDAKVPAGHSGASSARRGVTGGQNETTEAPATAGRTGGPAGGGSCGDPRAAVQAAVLTWGVGKAEHGTAGHEGPGGGLATAARRGRAR